MPIRVVLKPGMPRTEWSLRSPEERRRILTAPFPTRTIPSATWAGTIVVDDTDDPVLRHYRSVGGSDGDGGGSFDNMIRNLEGD